MNNIIQARVKLPQNIQTLVGEIGEKQVLLRLSIIVHQPDWSVFQNLGESGYDLLVMNSKTGERIRLEVKTRQKLNTTGKGKHQVQLFLTDGEHQACDFLIAYYLDRNRFYIVPKSELRLVRVVDKVRWRFTLSVDEEGIPHKGKDKYLDAWGSLHPNFQYKDI